MDWIKERNRTTEYWTNGDARVYRITPETNDPVEVFVLSRGGSFMPGLYASSEAAKRAAGFCIGALQLLQDFADRRAGGVGGTITLEDLGGKP